MKVIRHGDLSKINKTMQFTCKRCGCVFNADENECNITFFMNDLAYICDCPDCGHGTYIYGEETK